MLRFTDNLIMQLTRDCNLHCKYCFQGSKEQWKDKQFTVEEFKKAVDMALYQRCILGRIENNIEFHFHGGEVTLLGWPKMQEMLEHLLIRKTYFPGISISTQTNGLGVTEDMCKFYARYQLNIGLSIDDMESVDRMEPGQMQKLISHLMDLKEKTGCHFSALSVLSKHNMKVWYEDACKLVDMGLVDSVGVNVICPSDQYDEMGVTPEEQWTYWMEPVLKSYLTDKPLKERDVSVAIGKVLQDIIFSVDRTKCNKTGCFDRICGHGSNMIAIDPSMNLYNCDKYLDDGAYIDSRVGYPLDSRDFLGMQQVNRSLKYYKYIRDLELSVGCDKCPAKWLCPGECQSYSISKYGKYTLNEGMCSIYNRIYQFVTDNWLEILQHARFEVHGIIQDTLAPARDAIAKAGLKLVVDYDYNEYFLVKDCKE